MAISLDTIVAEDVLMYSSQLPDFTFSTDYDLLNICIYNRKDYVELFINDMYAYDGKILLCDVRSIVEQYMRTNGLTYINIIVEAQNDGGEEVLSVNLKVLFSLFTPNITAPQFAREHFLTTRSAKYLDKQTIDHLQAYVEKDEVLDLNLHIVSLDWDDKIIHTVIKASSTASDTKVMSLEMSYINMYDYAGREACKAVLSASLRYGQRVFMFYFTDRMMDVRFSFRNAFNVWENLLAEGTTKTKTTVEKSEAVCSGISSHYDKINSQIFDVKVAPMSTEEAEWMTQFLLSHHIYKGTEDERILIDSFAHEISDDDDEQHKIEFGWKYADRNRLSVSLPTEHNANMFANEFTEPFE